MSGEALEPISDGAVALDAIRRSCWHQGVAHLIDNKFKQIANQEYQRFGTVDLIITLYRTGPDESDDFIVRVKTARPDGTLTDPQTTYSIRLSRSTAGQIIGVQA